MAVTVQVDGGVVDVVEGDVRDVPGESIGDRAVVWEVRPGVDRDGRGGRGVEDIEGSLRVGPGGSVLIDDRGVVLLVSLVAILEGCFCF
jgi:hypothetical protein